MDAVSQARGATAELAHWLAAPEADQPSERALQAAAHAVLDWTAVAVAGSREPLVRILVEDALANGDTGSCGLVCSKVKTSPAFAALINGAASHALDYDDVNMRMRGHPTVTIMPALLAAAHGRMVSGKALFNALIAGTEAACIVGEMIGSDHYQRGFHTTATVGTIAAAAAVARLLNLSEKQIECALGLAATQASGLQAMFGTMAKPLHAGKAAMNGLLAARWAGAGFTAGDAVLEGDKGFGATQSGAFQALGVRRDRSLPYGIEQNVYKYHAACYYTHSAIEAASALLAENEIEATEIVGVVVALSPNELTVCDIPGPQTGLEMKFSIRHLVAMALLGRDTGRTEAYSTQEAQDDAVSELRSWVTTQPHDFERRTASRVTISLANGDRFERMVDVGIPADDLDVQERKLIDKFCSLCAPAIGSEATSALIETVLRLGEAEDLDAFLRSLAAAS